MKISARKISATRLIVLIVAGVVMTTAVAEQTPDSKTVMGPRNVNLADGADALRKGDIDEGVRLTLLGLETAYGQREKTAALSNLCAGYMLLGEFEHSLGYCNQALEVNERNWRAYNNRALVYMELDRYEEAEADVIRGQELAPGAKSLKVVKGILLDETHPVSPNIIIDDRRDPIEDEG
jgi:tetratricopeptide (TPR) repeat protein